MLILWIIVSIVMFSIIVVIHEYGHYKASKIFGIHVEEFGLWIPPRAKKLWKNTSGTLFSLNWIPLWGFVKIAGENELHLEYYGKKWKLLSLSSLRKKLDKKDPIYDKNGEEISKVEKKLLKSRIKNFRPWENFYEKNIWQKSLVLLAGVIMNFLLAAGIFIVLFLIWVKPVWINSIIETDRPSKLIPTLSQSIDEWIIIQNPGIILFPLENSPSSQAGVLENDILLRVNEQSFSQISQLQTFISSQKNANISAYIERKTACPEWNLQSDKCPIVEYLELEIPVNSEWKIGTYLSPNYQLQQDFEYTYWLWDAIKYGFLETYYQIRLTLSWLWMLLTNIFSPETPEDREEALEQVAGPIWIVWVISSALAGWWKLILVLWAIISINLWVFNLLPIPALDGWRLLLLWIRTIIEKIFGRSTVFVNIENLIHLIFFVTLIALSILIAYNDILNISSR